MFAVAAASVCSASRMSGRLSSSSDGSPAGTAAGRFCSLTAMPRRIGPGLRPSSTESSFSFAEISRSSVELDRLDALELRLGLAEVQLSGDAALEAVLGELHGLAARLDRVTRDLEPEVGVAQLEVGPGHVRDQREHGGAARLLRAQEERLLRLGGAADAAEEVELPRDVGGDGVDRGLGPLGRDARVPLRRVDAGCRELKRRRPAVAFASSFGQKSAFVKP